MKISREFSVRKEDKPELQNILFMDNLYPFPESFSRDCRPLWSIYRATTIIQNRYSVVSMWGLTPRDDGLIPANDLIPVNSNLEGSSMFSGISFISDTMLERFSFKFSPISRQ